MNGLCSIASCMNGWKKQIHTNWADDGNTFLEKQIVARIAALALAPLSFLACASDIVSGVLPGCFTLITGNEDLADLAYMELQSSYYLLSRTYFLFLRTVNPQAEKESVYLLTDIVHRKLVSYAENLIESDSIISSKILSRLVYVALAVASVVTNAIDGVIGAAAAACSMITLGYFDKLNGTAYAGLRFPGLIYDLFFCAFRLKDPDISIYCYSSRRIPNRVENQVDERNQFDEENLEFA